MAIESDFTARKLDADALAGVSGGQNVSLTEQGDRFDPARGSQSVDGLGGNDTIYLGGGNDAASGGDGNDSIDGGTGADTIHGGAGDDRIDGGAGDGAADSVMAGDGNDTYIWGPEDGADTFVGGGGWNAIHLHGVSFNELAGALASGDVVDQNGKKPYAYSGSEHGVYPIAQGGQANLFSGTITLRGVELTFENVSFFGLKP
jgi:Ca2+-binding RTX toxin-like protein